MPVEEGDSAEDGLLPQNMPDYEPTLDLRDYKYPTLDLLETHGSESDGGAVIDMTLEVKDKRQLERVVSAIRRISGVRDIERVNERT